MKKQISFALMAYCVLVVAGTATLTYWDRLDTRPADLRPEGYSLPAPSGPGDGAQTGPVRVMHLDVADNVYRHLDRSLELVALTPGSGWMRLNTDDGISPLISFDRVEKRDIRQFNAFAASIGEPIRVRLAGDRLEVFTAETRSHADRLADSQAPAPARRVAFFRPKVAKTELVMRRDAEGRIYLVDTGSNRPANDAEALAAKR